MKHLLPTLALAIVAWPLAADAADIYRWVDERGRTQLSDTVPEKYRATAVRVDTRQFEVSPAQLREAQARADRDKARGNAAALPEPARAGAPRRNAAAGSLGNASPAPGPGSDCEALLQRYQQSQACFAPFFNANGSLKVEAYKACEAVEDPTVKCGSPRAY